MPEISAGDAFGAEDAAHMARALELARFGEGTVEPNPLVGCVIVREGRKIAEGWHAAFGGPHAEIAALRQAPADALRGATLYVTLEPCCHQGKTPPCTHALRQAAIARVVVGCVDPHPLVAGRGLQALREAGIAVDCGVLHDEARRLIAPFAMLVREGRPWVHAKWAMTLDGKLATRTGSSQWISGPASRVLVHRLRGRVDAVLVGRRTAEIDDPWLTARPPGPRTPLRIVLDSAARLSRESRLVRTARESPLLVAASAAASEESCRGLREAGAEVLQLAGPTHAARIAELLAELGRRQAAHLLVEGGARVLGCFADLRLIDEVHAFIAPRLAGGSDAPSPVAGLGVGAMSEASILDEVVSERVEDDLYVRGRVRRHANDPRGDDPRGDDPCADAPRGVAPTPPA
jgi:diaminohydroxyphosphoribosylaminopyrimidine deaminase/5-amino-6-(5-phosphoribosylamino)uracil reductase